jgi:Fur family transcriptional regulator, ferric uptake regulator
MAGNKVLDLLSAHSLSNTACRRSILKVFLSNSKALSHHDVEQFLNFEYDRVTIYRTFHSFEEKGVIHKIIDNEGVARYAICSSKCDAQHHHDKHLHFSCTKCNETICIEDTEIPSIILPSGYKLEKLNILGEGLCKNCSDKKCV